jgi:hypothetical protein
VAATCGNDSGTLLSVALMRLALAALGSGESVSRIAHEEPPLTLATLARRDRTRQRRQERCRRPLTRDSRQDAEIIDVPGLGGERFHREGVIRDAAVTRSPG